MINIGPPLSDLLTLAGRVSDRLISEEAALRSAQAQQQAFTLSELAAFCAVSGELFEETPDDAYYFFRLALALAETNWGRDRHSLWWQTADWYIETTRKTLLKAPRASRLNHAIKTAEQQIEILKENIKRQRRGRGRLSPDRRALIADEKKELADTLQGAGWLLAAPYCIMLDPDDLADSFAHWLAPYKLDCATYYSASHMGLGDKVGQEGIWKGSRIGSMPDPAQALPRAMEYLNEALRYAPPSLRHSCEVKRAQVLALLARVDPERGEEHWQQAEVALESLDHEIALNELPETLRAMALWGPQTGTLSVGSLPFPARNLRENLPPASALGILADLVVLVDSRDLPELWDEIHAIYANSVRLPMISPRFWMALAHRTPGNRLTCPTALMPYSVLIPDVEEECESLALPPSVRAATLVHAALHVSEDDFADAIELLDHIHLVDQSFADTYAEMVDYVLMQSRKRYAEHLTSQGDHFNALLQYACAVEPAARFAWRHTMPGFGTGLINKSIECVDQGAKSDHSSSAIALLKIAEPVVTGIVGALEHHAAFVYGLGQRTMAYLLARGFPNAGNIAFHHILFKGFDFRILSHNSGPRTNSPIAADLHREIRALEAATAPYAPGIDLEESDDGIAGISALHFVSSAEITPTQQVVPTVENLRRVADREITRYLIHGSYQAEGFQLLRPREFEVQEIVDGMGDDTVFISLYLAEGRMDEAGPLGVRTRLVASYVTREIVTSRTTKLDMPGSLFNFTASDGESAHTMHSAAIPVARAREALNEDPLDYPVTLGGAQILTEHYTELGGPAAERLRLWRSTGKRHLCFWPHGPLHYSPLHLLHLDGRPLADDWIITTVSSSAQVSPRPTPTARRHRALIVGSASGGVPFGLSEQPQLNDHIHKLKKHLPDARLIPDATPRKVITAVADAEYIHIAAHGSQDAEAPWHQCLYLNGEQGEDGRLFAHEILTLDLRGVEVVTLSACESALGRYDTNDNHRGLPAAFLLAGAATVVGALWPVAPPVATLFFEEFYSLLSARHPKRDAFHHAQRITRHFFPQYRDWGAFVFMGHWR